MNSLQVTEILTIYVLRLFLMLILRTTYTFVSLVFFLLLFCFFFFMLAIRHFFARLAKKPHSFFPGNLDFGRVGEKEKNVVFSW